MEDGLLVHAEKERARLDAALQELLRKRAGIQARVLGDYDAVHPVDASRPGHLDGKLQRVNRRQPASVLGADRPLTFHDLVHPAKLSHPERRLDVGEAEVVAELFVIEALLRLKGEVPERPDASGEIGVVGNDHPALAGGDELVGVEAEGAECPEAAAAAPTWRWAFSLGEVLGAVRFGSVFDHGQLVPGRQLQHGIHVDRVPEDMHGHDRAGPIGDLRLYLQRIHAPGVGLAVDEYRHRAACDDGESARDDGRRRQYDLVLGIELQTCDRGVKGRSAVANGDPMLPPAVLGPP